MTEAVQTDFLASADDVDAVNGEMVVAADDATATIARLNDSGSLLYSSISDTSFKGRIETLKAVTNAVKLSDHIGVPINIVDIVVQPVEVMDAATGKMVPTLRTIIINEKGESYYAISDGMLRSVQTFLGLVGQPSEWEEPITVVVREMQGKRGKYFTLNLA